MQMEVVYLGVALVSLCVVLLSRRRRRANEQPGPWQLPVIGSLHHLAGQLPHHALRDLARRHGPVMLLWLGEVPTLVVSSREGAREVMKTHDAAFATRPLNATMRVLTNGGRGIVFAPYGDYWRQLRKITVLKLLSARRVLSFRAIREEEVAAMLRDVADAAAAARPVELSAHISALVTDITVRAVMGDRFKERDVFLRSLDRGVKLAAGFNPPDLWPSSWLVGWLSGGVRRVKDCRDTGTGILDPIIREHLEKMEDGGGQKEDLLDVLLRIQKEEEGRLQFPLDMDTVKSVILDIFGAGSETAATTLGWAFAELIRNPMVMQKATAEVRQTFEARGTIAEEALNELSYLHLVIRETLRLHTPLPLLIPRECRESCQVLGYDVPRGTQVLVNAWALARDERYWPDAPDVFRPERFEGEAAGADFRGTDFSFLPFGAGRRMCPGIEFGLANVELALASLLFHFDWEGTPPGELDMAEVFGITVRRKAGLLVRPVLRVPVPRVLSDGNGDR
ncbi:dolabradiene monooxygenase-like [Triticum dicoccoides]|uniref:dolabradiene monooxygenase-like n=1 Tax=Triticum dicoccoides TaxID=85692 RepID=UPI00189041A2|nr:dolabradiene monooxygenase-like [Triticum dicoccoides]